MTRFLSEPYYSLLTKQGRRDIRWAIKHRVGLRYLPGDIIGDTWFSIKFKVKKLL